MPCSEGMLCLCRVPILEKGCIGPQAQSQGSLADQLHVHRSRVLKALPGLSAS